MAVTWEHARPRVRGAAAAILLLAPPAVTALLAGLDGRADRTAASWLTALAALAAYAVQRWAYGRMRLSDPRAEAAVICVVVAGVLLAVAPELAAVVAVPVAVGVYADRRAAARRQVGMVTTGEQLARVAEKTAALVQAVHDRPSGEAEPVEAVRRSAVDGLVERFDAATSRALVWSRLAEILLAPVSVVSVVLVTGVALDRPWRDALVCSLFAPLAAGALAGLGERSRPAPSAPARGLGSVVRAGDALVRELWRLRRDEVTALAAPAIRVAILAAIAQGGALALATTIPAALRRHAAVWPWTTALAVLVVAHAVLLARSARLAQRGGTATLRALSHEVGAKITATPRARLTDPRVFAATATKDVVGASGLVVHGFRPGIGLVLVPCVTVLGGALLAVGDHEAPRLLLLLTLGGWLAAYARSAGPVGGGLRRGLDALGRVR